MSGLSIDQLVLDRTSYGAQRTAERQRIVPMRGVRRVQVGPHLSLCFENDDTVRFQVQEMIFVEDITDERAVEEEIDVYRRLVPTGDALMATMFLEFADVSTVNAELDALHGIQHLVELHLGDSVVRGEDVPPPDDVLGEQTFTVHFLRFRFDEAARAALADLRAPARLVVAHANYRADADIEPQTRSALVADLDAAAR
jgi:hypothetical protein